MIKNMKKTKKINVIIGYMLNILIIIVVLITMIGLYYMAQIKILKKELTKYKDYVIIISL